MKGNRWIQGSIRHKGRAHRYLMREFGERAFKEDGTIKEEYLDKGIARAKANGETGLERALLEARNLKEIAKERQEAYA